MIRHLFRLIWNRKRANALIIIEIFFSFLVVYAVMTLALYYYNNYRHPLGFERANVWRVSIDQRNSYSTISKVQRMENLRQLMLALRSFREIREVAGAGCVPYSTTHWESAFEDENKRPVSMGLTQVTKEFKDVMGIHLVRGRWFNEDDIGINWEPIVINEHLAKRYYGNNDPIGKALGKADRRDGQRRVIGVITDFRQDGEYAELRNYAISFDSMADTNHFSSNLLVKVQPGTPTAFEEDIINRLKATVKDWTYTVESLDDMRDSALQRYTMPLITAGLVAGFLLLMVALGLIGVIWQNITRRTREIGLRRALGGTAADVYQLVLGELVMVATFGLVAGTLIAVQFPLLSLIAEVPVQVYVWSLVISLGLLYLVTLLCGLYPGRLATRVQPSEALHYE